MIGMNAEVVAYDENKGDGRIMARGELWHFRTESKGQKISVGDEVTIKSADGMTFIVVKK